MASISALTSQMDELVARVEQIPEQDFITSIPAAAPAPDGSAWTDGITLTKADVRRDLLAMRAQMESLSSDRHLLSSQRIMAHYYVNHAIGQFRQALDANLVGGNAWNFVSQLHNLRMQLDAAGAVGPYTDHNGKPISPKVLAQASIDASNWLGTRSKIDSAVESLQQNQQQAGSIAASLKSTLEAAELDKGRVNSILSSISTAKEDLRPIEADIRSSAHMSADSRTKIIEIEAASRLLLEKIEDRLGAINRISLGGAYELQKAVLNRARLLWNIAFVMSLIALAGCALFASMQSGLPSDWAGVIGLVLKLLPVTGSFVWLAYYCASKAGIAERAAEDYAFKVAAAMSFEGYKKEVGGDPELLKLLLQKTIHTFGENPVRLYPRRPEAYAPIEKLLQLTDEDRKALMKLLAEFLSSKKP